MKYKDWKKKYIMLHLDPELYFDNEYINRYIVLTHKELDSLIKKRKYRTDILDD